MTVDNARAVRAHEASVKQTLADVLRALQEAIGRNLTAFIVDKSPATVDRWVEDKQHPGSDEAEARVRAAYQVVRLITDAGDSAHLARAWMLGLNPQLDDESPADVLREGRVRDVLIAAKAFGAGG